MVKKAGIVFLILVLGAAGLLAVRTFRSQSVAAQDAPAPPSEESARGLEHKIQAIKAAQNTPEHQPQTVEVTEAELESYVWFELQSKIPARLQAVDVQLTPGSVGADVRLTFPPNATGNVAIDTILSGTHTFFVKGKLTAENRRGRFILDETKLDGIPVPTILIEGLISRYVKPLYPEVDLSEPFDLPWNIKSIAIASGSASVSY